MTALEEQAAPAQRTPPAYKRWLDAELAARQCEDRLHQQWVGFFFDGRQPPSSDDQRKAAVLRSVAHVALSEARVEREALKMAAARQGR
jgi:hypothetical protein